MKAIIVSKYGAPEVMQVVEREKPEIGANEILIKVKASSLSPVDMAFRKGDPWITRLFLGLFKPKNDIPGDIIAGIIDQVGQGVSTFTVGDLVYGHVGLKMGGHGEFVKVKSDEAIVKMPDHMSFDEAAAFAYSAMTALPFMEEHYHITPETKVLINGGSGAIGTFAIQLAKQKGGHVTAVCSVDSVPNIKLLGVDHIIDYESEDFTKAKDQYDLIFDAVGKSSFSRCKKVLNDHGIYLSTVPNFSLLIRSTLGLKSHHRKAKFIATGLRKNDQKKIDLNKLSNYYEKGVLKAVIDRTFTQSEIVKAHEYIESGKHKGNVILRME